jgi:hypothetical protein
MVIDGESPGTCAFREQHPLFGIGIECELERDGAREDLPGV